MSFSLNTLAAARYNNKEVPHSFLGELALDLVVKPVDEDTFNRFKHLVFVCFSFTYCKFFSMSDFNKSLSSSVSNL